MKKYSLLLFGMFFLLMTSGLANATLITIGTATYSSATNAANNTSQSTTENVYNLIWDDDNNGNSVVWLDYTNTATNWTDQNDWASGLNGVGVGALTYSIDPTYTVDWGTNNWRLPTTVDGPYEDGYDGTTTAGVNITSSEMGHLYYEELDNLGNYDTYGVYQSGYGLTNTGDFNNLIASWYWSGTEYADNPDYGAWVFNMSYGNQFGVNKSNDLSGLAVRSGQVSAAPVPEPATMLLFGIGLMGLAGFGRQRKGSCV